MFFGAELFDSGNTAVGVSLDVRPPFPFKYFSAVGTDVVH
jgi:hypothetical protein